jgi:hypothetical protein
MKRYLIQRVEDGKFVTPPGSLNSYTGSIRRGRLYPSYEAAKAECYENERPVCLDDLLEEIQ